MRPLNKIAIIALLSIAQFGFTQEAPVEQKNNLEKKLLEYSSKHGDETKAAIKYMLQHMPEVDKKNLTAEYLITNLEYALKTRTEFPWSKQIPLEIWLNDVLPYATVTESRDEWREDFYLRFKELVKDCKTINEATMKIMTSIQNELKVEYNTRRNRPDQGVKESMKIKMASCSGLTILAINACRAVGIPARMVGLISWSHVRGNHNWLEVWLGNGWHMVEYNSKDMDSGWVIDSCGLADTSNPLHRIYATTWAPKTLETVYFPLVWGMRFSVTENPEAANIYKKQQNVSLIPFIENEKPKYLLMLSSKHIPLTPAIDVSERYKTLAINQKKKKDQKTLEPNQLRFLLGFMESGSQAEVEVTFTHNGKEICKGKTNGKGSDANDLAEFILPKNAELEMTYSKNNKIIKQTIKTSDSDIQIHRTNR